MTLVRRAMGWRLGRSLPLVWPALEGGRRLLASCAVGRLVPTEGGRGEVGDLAAPVQAHLAGLKQRRRPLLPGVTGGHDGLLARAVREAGHDRPSLGGELRDV